MYEIKIINSLEQARNEMRAIGVDPAGIEIMAPKCIHRAIKLKDIDRTTASILKQEMLSLGGDVAVAKGTISASIAKTDILIIGTMRQFSELVRKIKYQHMPELANVIDMVLRRYHDKLKPLNCRGYILKFDKPLIQGVVNITPDSFSDGGKYMNVEAAVKHAKDLVHEGADIIDIGGESSRPGSLPITAEEELRRILPVVKQLVKEVDVPISVDTYKPVVAEACFKAGAHMLNDITGVKNEAMIPIIKKYNVPVNVMHMKGMPEDMQDNPNYDDVMYEIISFFRERLNKLLKAGVKQIVVDPGIGFGKRLEDNLFILKNLAELKCFGLPILVGTSRKSFIGKVSNLPEITDRLEGTIASNVVAVMNGADIVRVHDVQACKRALEIVNAIEEV